MRCNQVILYGLLLLVSVSVSSCAKPKLAALDGRTCPVAVLDSETAMLLRAAQIPAKAGDGIYPQACAKEDALDRRNHLLELTR